MAKILLVNTPIIYKATSPSGKVYVGQTIFELVARKTRHLRDAKNPTLSNYNSKFYRAIRKYGNKMKWEIIEKDVPIELLNVKECEWIQDFNSYRDGYNETLGGDGGSPMLGRKHSEETKKKIKESNLKTYSSLQLREKFKGENNPRFGIDPTKETKAKMRQAKLGIKQSDEHKKKISDALKKAYKEGRR